ncbi:hypothetical protein [Deinococcus sedimenti]|uniref:HEAT repeat domain-containing protein n=1 Tax=Deinococcus sedimenti TaxID=1867090 RepID=A0ABQ2S6X4_9DEIO|nr:hypothetical protein [Deinococcus sedimenti]GGS00494.1 hypothetical protein GCM10008960_28980 [Deinococcus sedimenti]
MTDDVNNYIDKYVSSYQNRAYDFDKDEIIKLKSIYGDNLPKYLTAAYKISKPSAARILMILLLHMYPHLAASLIYKEYESCPDAEKTWYITILSEVNCAPAIRMLEAIATKEANETIRAEAVQELMHYGDRQSIKALEKVREEDNGSSFDGIPISHLADVALEIIRQRITS